VTPAGKHEQVEMGDGSKSTSRPQASLPEHAPPQVGKDDPPVHGARTRVAAVVVDVLLEVVLVVELGAHPLSAHAGQHGSGPVQAAPPGEEWQADWSRLIVHRVRPRASVRQQVIAPGLPHVERAAHRFSAFRHCGRSCSTATRSFAMCAAQRT